MSGGHIRKRGRNSWELKFDAARENGCRRPVYKSFKGSKREAQAELARLITAVADGDYIAPSKLTVRDLLRERMKVWQGTGKISPRTAQGYEDLIDGYVLPYLGTNLVQKLSTREIETWHSTLMTKGRRGRNGRPNGEGGLSARTVGHAQRVLSKALAEAVRHGLLTKNVCTIQRAPKLAAEEMQILLPEQVNALPAQLHGHELEVPALVALFCGLRRGEVLGLRWKNVDLDEEVIRVRESLEETSARGLRFKGPKSEAGIRDVTLPAIVTDALVEQRKRLLERRLMLGQGKLTGEDLVFPAWDGSAQSPDTFGRAWSRLAKGLGIEVSFHGLRHTHASMLIDRNVDVVTISKRLGHSSPAITLQVYAHLFRKDDSKAAAAINAALRG
jgi:integrase